MKFSITNVLESSTNVNLVINFANITLEEAVAIIDAIDAKIGGNLSKMEEPNDNFKEYSNEEMDKEIVALINAGSLLSAVKYHKEQTGWGLKESKDYCDRLKAKYC